MDKTYTHTADLLAKINDLMDYRMLPHLIDLVESDAAQKQRLLDQLTDLQVAIYHLDHYLETTWHLQDDELEARWLPIYNALTLLGVDGQHHRSFASHILKYQRHEMQLRQLLLPTRLDMEYFYFYKSCDVKLLRRIIMMHYPALARMYSPADWRVFDLVTEVDDDVEDVIEDLDTINGNRYLISIWQYGFDETQAQFLAFLAKVEAMMTARFGDERSVYHSHLLGWSRQALADTRQRIIRTTRPDLDHHDLWLSGRVERYAKDA